MATALTSPAVGPSTSAIGSRLQRLHGEAEAAQGADLAGGRLALEGDDRLCVGVPSALQAVETGVDAVGVGAGVRLRAGTAADWAAAEAGGRDGGGAGEREEPGAEE